MVTFTLMQCLPFCASKLLDLSDYRTSLLLVHTLVQQFRLTINGLYAGNSIRSRMNRELIPMELVFYLRGARLTIGLIQ